jgi:hypothetical protein
MVIAQQEVRAVAGAARSGRSSVPIADALDYITHDHATIRELFALYADTPLADLDAREDVTRALLGTLELHTAVETDVFYRALADVLRDGNRLRSAFDSHIEILALVRQVRATRVDDPEHARLMAALRTATEAHFDEEETHLFAGARDSAVDLGYLGRQLLRRRDALQDAAAAGHA